MAWDKYDFIDELKDFIRTDCGENATYDEIEDYIRNEVDRNCIYTSDCWEIAQELSDFDPTDIAYDALYEYAMSEIDIDEMVDELATEDDEDEDEDFDESYKKRNSIRKENFRRINHKCGRRK